MIIEIIILLLLISGAYLIGKSEVTRYFLEPQAKTEEERKKLNRNWHIYRDLGMFLYLIMAYIMPNNLIETLKFIPLLAALHWTVSDGIQNIIKAGKFFYISPTSGNYVEKFGKWYIKIGLILIGIIIKFFIFI